MDIFRHTDSFDKVGSRIEFRSQWPGVADGDLEKEDYAFGPLQSFDHALIRKGTIIKMHEHKNDEIISYLVHGEFVHEDSAGSYETLASNRYMLMSAGKSFFHQESTPHADAEMLQIFIRPREVDLAPNVQFAAYDASEQLRLIAAPQDAPLIVRQNVFIYDLKVDDGTYTLPKVDGLVPCVYVFEGSVTINGERLEKRDGATGADIEELRVEEPGVVIVFLVDIDAPMTKEGPFSGRNRPTEKIVSRMWKDVQNDID